jgi:hypothetical protein
MINFSIVIHSACVSVQLKNSNPKEVKLTSFTNMLKDVSSVIVRVLAAIILVDCHKFANLPLQNVWHPIRPVQTICLPKLYR